MDTKMIVALFFAFVVGVIMGRITTWNRLNKAEQVYRDCDALLRKIEIIKEEMDEKCPILDQRERISRDL